MTASSTLFALVSLLPACKTPRQCARAPTSRCLAGLSATSRPGSQRWGLSMSHRHSSASRSTASACPPSTAKTLLRLRCEGLEKTDWAAAQRAANLDLARRDARALLSRPSGVADRKRRRRAAERGRECAYRLAVSRLDVQARDADGRPPHAHRVRMPGPGAHRFDGQCAAVVCRRQAQRGERRVAEVVAHVVLERDDEAQRLVYANMCAPPDGDHQTA